MKYTVQITKITNVDEIPNAWSSEDYIALLKECDYPDAESIAPAELREMLFMALTDFEGPDAAEILLKYKLSDHLSEGQIHQISHDMLEDNVCEEYPVIGLHAALFDVNQLLYKAFNGTFPLSKATIVECSIKRSSSQEITKEIVLKAFGESLSDRCVLKRLFEDQLHGEIAFPEAEDILWQLASLGDSNYKFITSDYWLSKEDFTMDEFEGTVVEFEEED